MIPRDLTQSHIDGLNRIRGVDDLANILWEGKTVGSRGSSGRAMTC